MLRSRGSTLSLAAHASTGSGSGVVVVSRPGQGIQVSQALETVIMSLLVDETRDGRSIHVLIIGVGISDWTLEHLEGLGGAVGRLYGWWRDEAGGRCPAGWSIGTIDVVASDKDGLSLASSQGQPTVPAEPTLANVTAAIRAWLDRIPADGMGVLHWSGHGACVGLSGPHPIDVLFCSDSDGVDDPMGIDWGETLTGLRMLANGRRIACFIDACRNRPMRSHRYPPVFDKYPFHAGDGIFVHYSTVRGGEALSYKSAIPEAQFEGGPIATNAAHDALDKFCADIKPTMKAYALVLDKINSVMIRRATRIGARIDELEPGWSPNMDGTYAAWSGLQIMDIPVPMSMFDVKLKGRSTENLECEVRRESDGKLAEVSSSVDGFETTLPYLNHHVTVRDTAAEGRTIHSESVAVGRWHQEHEVD